MLALAGDAAGGIAHLEEALRLQPDLADAHYMLGELLRKGNQSQKAIDHYQTVLRLKPDFFQAYVSLASILSSQNRSEEAIATAEKGIGVARTSGQLEQAEQIEEWLKHYRAELRRSENFTPSKAD